MRLLAALAILAGCGQPSRSAPDPAPAPTSHAAASDADCVRDTDCVLLPTVTCCGECEPVPPFDVGTVEDLNAILIESEERCAHDTRPCAPLVCEPRPRGCWARAVCVEGRCIVDSEGC